ncbi:hypothetical protein CBS101457_001079 [Exobasidium rhododendri]|nr:hypothetical protein CBS101457_001079 [Exobasidium rhododendri]
MPNLAWEEARPEESLETFLAKNAPSKTFKPESGDGWIWVRSDRESEVEGESSSQSLEVARKVVDGLVDRYQDIEDNAKIPKIKSKTSGPSKKMMKDLAAKEAEERLRSIGKEWPCGKWLFYERAGFVDNVFSKLAKSIIDGPLSKLKHASCHTVKVSTADGLFATPSHDSRREATSLICLYFNVVWNAEHAKEVLECIVKEHGEIPNSAKADLYTATHIDSHHPSKLRSTLYRPAELFNYDLLKEWQAEFRANLKREPEKGENGEGSVKRRALSDGHGVPVKPEDYWSTKDDDDDFEEVRSSEKDTKVGERASPLKENTGSQNPDRKQDRSVAKITSSGKEGTRTAESDSDTEDEDEFIIETRPLKKATSLSPAAKESPSTAIPNEKRNASPDPGIKQTILPIPTTLSAKKRDRFGRTDF